MSFVQNRLLGILLVSGLASYGLGACSSTSDNGGGSGGTTSSGGSSTTPASTGGATSAGGSQGTGGAASTGGKPGSGGAPSSGGAPGSGGAVGTGGAAQSGGSPGSGGAPAGTGGAVGSGGSTVVVGGGPGKDGGVAGAPGTGGGTPPGSGGAGAGGGGGCQKGLVKAKEVVIMGESFYAMDPKYIEKRIEQNAQKAGAIASGESYRNVAVSGQPMSYIASTEWDNAVKSTTKFVIMDGGGIDCMSSSCSSCPDTFKTLLGKMATAGVQDVLYTRYPEPGAPPGSNATLKGNLDTLMPKMETVCKASTSPKCHWVDLRPVWVTGDTTDGLHPTQSGGDHVGDLIWQSMVKDCLAQ
jgi:hypothetical protein